MKSQMGLNAVKYFIIAIVIAASLIFGYKAISSISKSNCISQLTIMEADLKDSIRVKATDIGSREELRYDIPCKVDYAFAVDLDKKDDQGSSVVQESFFDFPYIGDSIESKSSNLFLVRDDEVIASYHIGNIDIEYPYYECYKVISGRLGLMIEGRGLKTRLKQTDSRFDCTLDKAYSLELASSDHDDICSEVSDIGGNCILEGEDIITTNRTIEIEDERITITIDIDPELQSFSYWEELPKCVAQGLAQRLVFEGLPGSTNQPATCTFTYNPQFSIESCEYFDTTAVPESGGIITIDFGDFIIEIREKDPLMVWHFTSEAVAAEKIVYYLEELRAEITSECLREIRGVVTGVLETGDAPSVDIDNDGIPDIADITGGVLADTCPAGDCQAGLECTGGFCQPKTCTDCILGYEDCINGFCRLADPICSSTDFTAGGCGDFATSLCGLCSGVVAGTSTADGWKCASGSCTTVFDTCPCD